MPPPPKLYLPRTSESECIWNKRLWKCNSGKDFKMRQSCIRVGPESNVKCPYNRQKNAEKRMRKGHVKMKVGLGVDVATSRRASGASEAGGNKEGFSPRDVGGNAAPATLGVQTCGLQTGERVNFWCFEDSRFVIICYGRHRKLLFLNLSSSSKWQPISKMLKASITIILYLKSSLLANPVVFTFQL